MDNTKTYLGDGLYAVYNGFSVELRANDFNNPSDRVFLESSVMNALIDWYNKLLQKDED